MNVFDPDMHINYIVIVGLGGTGSQIARSVARIIYDMRQARMHTPQLALFDPDLIEAKNVGRQLYVEADIGQPKARVLMRRFNMALGLDIAAYEGPFDIQETTYRHNTLVIGAVDNHEARRSLAKLRGCIWIDAGNHFNNGQVVIGNSGHYDTVLKGIKGEKGKYRNLPTAPLLFPNLLEPEPPKPEPEPDVSCAELVAKRDQDLFINDWMAMVTSQYAYKLLHRQPIHSFMTFVGSEDMVVRSVPISQENISAYLQPQEEEPEEQDEIEDEIEDEEAE